MPSGGVEPHEQFEPVAQRKILDTLRRVFEAVLHVRRLAAACSKRNLVVLVVNVGFLTRMHRSPAAGGASGVGEGLEHGQRHIV